MTNWFKRHKIITILGGTLISLGGIGLVLISTLRSAPTEHAGSATTSTQPKTNAAMRQPQGVAVTLGAGTFTGGKDIQVGLYDVTPGTNQSDSFIMTGATTYTEIVGGTGGSDKVRAKISSGDMIKISSLTAGAASLTFTPVTAAFVTAYAPAVLYAGTFIVGEDIGAGRYTITPGIGQSCELKVSGSMLYKGTLGNNSAFGDQPSVSLNLVSGDIITITSLNSLNQVTFTPST